LIILLRAAAAYIFTYNFKFSCKLANFSQDILLSGMYCRVCHCNSGKYYYGYNYTLTRVLMNANGSGQCRRVSTGPKPNHTRSRNYIWLTDNCVKWKLQATETSNRDWFIVSIAGILDNCARLRRPMHHDLPLWSQNLDRDEIVFASVD